MIFIFFLYFVFFKKILLDFVLKIGIEYKKSPFKGGDSEKILVFSWGLCLFSFVVFLDFCRGVLFKLS